MSWRRDDAITPTDRQRRRARGLRSRLTEPEKRLWWHLRHRMPLPETHWRRQVPLAGYVVDFCCLQHRLVVEVDGDHHGFERHLAYDAERTRSFESQGFRVLRFSNRDVMTSIDVVLDTILAALGSATPTPDPSPQGGGGARRDSIMRAPDGPLIVRGDVILAVEHVSLAFGGVKALTDVSFDIQKGEIRAIIGPNGAGKTSMLNCINGFYHPTEGAITFKGRRRPKMRPSQAARGGISRTFQNVALFKGMTTLDNIMVGRSLKMSRGFGWQLLRLGPAMREEVEHRRVVEDIIDFLEIQAIRKTPVGKLPYGLQKRVELGRALAMEPEILLLDEPMAGMNLEEKEDMCRFILDVNQQFGTTMALIEPRHGRRHGPVRPRRSCSNTAARSPTERRPR